MTNDGINDRATAHIVSQSTVVTYNSIYEEKCIVLIGYFAYLITKFVNYSVIDPWKQRKLVSL